MDRAAGDACGAVRCVHILEGNVYVVAGYADGGTLATVDRHNPATDTWDSVAAPMPAGRFRIRISWVGMPALVTSTVLVDGTILLATLGA